MASFDKAAGRAYGRYIGEQLARDLDPVLFQYLQQELHQELQQELEPDGPLPGNRFRFAGQIHEKLPPTVWKLLSAAWGHDERNMHDVDDEVWGCAMGPERKSAMTKLKKFLKGIGYPRYLSKAAKSDSLVWKAF